MARKQTLDAIIQLYKKLGGNTSEVLGTKTNINFLGKGKSPELMLDMDINADALGVLPRSKAVEELKGSVGYAVSGKLNDIQANQLLKNMQTMDSVYFPPAAPANITDLASRTEGLTPGGLETLRKYADDLPPPGSRGGADDIAAPIDMPTGAGLEAIKNVKGSDLIVNDLVNTIYKNAGVSTNAQPVARANAREFLNRVKDLEDPEFPDGPTLSSIMEADDFKFMTEGGGGGMGDPLLLVQKYFGPRVASSVAKLDGPDEIQVFAERLVKVKDAKGNTITDRNFNPESVDIDDFEFAEGGLARPGYVRGRLVGKALGMFKKQQALEKGAGMGYADMRKYGIEGEDITNMFKEISMDPTLVGKEKTEYFKVLNQALKNPEEFPDTIKEIQMKLGIDVGLGFKSGGLAKILEV